MDVEILARLQFALTVMFHYIYPPLSIGLGLILVLVEGTFLITKNPLYLRIAKFWTRIFALTFSIGVATGIVMEFEFGTNWATYSRYVGDVFGSALAAEGVFAFFLESGFLALLLFGWNKIGPKMHFFSTLMVCLGAHFSAIWIVVANSWMQTPQGFHIVGSGMEARAEIISFSEMVLNPSSIDRLVHVIIGAWLAGAFLVISVSAFYLLRKKHIDFSKKSLKFGLSVAVLSCFLQAISGHSSARVVANYQPAKLAAFEGLYETTSYAPLHLFGIVNTKDKTVDYAIKIPGLLSFLTYNDPEASVVGLDKFPKEDWPNVAAVFQTYRLMIFMWIIMLLVSLTAIWLWKKDLLLTSPWMLKVLIVSVLCPQIANQAGWVSAEMGRYPWIVYNLLRISEGLSKSVSGSQVLGSMIMFTILYSLLFTLFIYLLDHKIKAGPQDHDEESPYHLIQHYVEEMK